MNFRINQITPLLLVSNLEHAIAFYVRQLGFALAFTYEGFYAGIEKDGHSIHLKTDYNAARGGAQKSNDEELDLLFSVDNVAMLFEEISKKDIEIVQPLREMPYGSEFYITDPDGHLIAFVGV
ncbi:VOC family protein [Dyadobacter jiangsuensis]|uniref:Putative glyoxalase superfamily protein PhnB n=1 Tax=Dyadobacter jiangsuensis TaxID=1591085 RepID=A0A2P8GB98_9BACT|nr:VOC family protein [Dyadobacter jiangsuensis]PSL31252.1 putative glyoxalase superfamily protein PhnB [Dyadobacter jiangsuensis]